MKKSEIMVSMPMTTFEELSSYKDRFFDLLNEIKDCYDTTLFDNYMDTIISLDVKKLIKLSKIKEIWQMLLYLKAKRQLQNYLMMKFMRYFR